MNAPTADRLVHDARIGPDDTPHEAATHLWAQVVANHDVDPDGPLLELGVMDRVVLVLRDAFELSPATVATVLHTNEAAVTASHRTARQRIGLPAEAPTCAGWAAVRADHASGDLAVLTDLATHARACGTCSSTAHDGQRGRSRWWARRAAGGAAHALHATPAAAAPALGGAVLAAAALVTAGVAVGALVGPVPQPPVPEPVVVDDAPELPSDEEPVGGWPATSPAEADAGTDGARSTDGASTPDDAGATEGNALDEATGTLDDTTDEVTDTLTDTIEDATDVVQDTVEDTTDTVQDTVDDVTDTLDGSDEVIDDTTDTLDGVEDTVDDTTDTVQDTVDDTTDAVQDGIQDTTDVGS